MTGPAELDGTPGEDGQGAAETADDATAQAWSTLVDARARVHAEATSLRKNVLLTAAVLGLAAVVLDRFIYLARPFQGLLALLPAALLVAGAGIDLAWYHRRDQRLRATIRGLEDDHPSGDKLREARSRGQRRPMPRLGLALFYLVPAALFVGVALWRAL